MPFVPPVVSVTIFANEECRHSSSFPRPCGTTKPKADGYSATRHRKRVGNGALHGTGNFARTVARLCPRGSSSPFDSVGKIAGAEAHDPPLRQAILPTLPGT